MSTLMLVNPRRRRKHSHLRKYQFGRKRRHLRHNPRRFGVSLGGIKSTAVHTVKAAFPAAVGAVLLDAAWAALPLPASVQSGNAKHLAKAAGAVGLGIVAGKVLGQARGSQFALGAMTVVIYNVLRQAVAQFAPSVKLDGISEYQHIGYYGSGQVQGLGAYMPESLETTMNPSLNMGEYQHSPFGQDF